MNEEKNSKAGEVHRIGSGAVEKRPLFCSHIQQNKSAMTVY